MAGSSVALSDELSRADTFDAVFYSDAAGMESVDAQLRDMQEKWSILAPGRQASLDEELLGVISPALDAVVLPESETWGRKPERQDPDSPPEVEVDTSILSDERQTSFDDVLTQVLDEALDVEDLALRPAESVQPTATTPEKIVPTPESSPADRLDTPEQDPYWRETLLMEEAIAAARKGKEAGEDAKAKQKATPPGPKAMKRMKQREDTFAKPTRLDLDPEATSDDALASALGAGPTLATGPAEIQSIDAPEAQAPSGAVTVTFADAGSLGLNLTTTEGRTTVLAVKSDTQAAQHPQLRPGLAITSVDGVDVSSSDHLAVTQTIVDHPQRPLTMTFADPSASKAVEQTTIDDAGLRGSSMTAEKSAFLVSSLNASELSLQGLAADLDQLVQAGSPPPPAGDDDTHASALRQLATDAALLVGDGDLIAAAHLEAQTSPRPSSPITHSEVADLQREAEELASPSAASVRPTRLVIDEIVTGGALAEAFGVSERQAELPLDAPSETPTRLDLDPEATSDDALASALGAGPTLATGPAEIQSIDAPEAQAPSGAVTVTFADAGSLGLNLTTTEGRTTVLAVKSDTQAAQHPQLRPGLAITSVDGVDVSSSDHLAVTQTIVDHPQRPLTMTFADPSIAESAPIAQLSLDASDPAEEAVDDSEEDQAEATPATIRAQRAAELHFNSHEYTAAIRCLEEALAAAPEDDLELTEQIRFVRERQAGEAERYCQTADDLTLERQYDDARAVYEQALGIHPEHAAARHGLARVEALLNLPVTPSAEGEDGRKRKSLFGGRRTGSSPTVSPLQHTAGGPGQDSEGAAELEPFSLSESAIKRAPDDISVTLDGDAGGPQTEDEQVKTQEELEGLLTEFTAQSHNEHIQSLRSRLSPGTEAATASTEARRQLEADLLAAQYLSEKLAKEVRIADVCSHHLFVTEMPHVQAGGPEEGLREDEVTPWSESDLDEGIPPEPETRAAMDALGRSQFKLKRWEKAKELTTKELT